MAEVLRLNRLSAWERFGTGDDDDADESEDCLVSIAFRLGNDSGLAGLLPQTLDRVVSQLPFGLGTIRDVLVEVYPRPLADVVSIAFRLAAGLESRGNAEPLIIGVRTNGNLPLLHPLCKPFRFCPDLESNG